MDHKLVLYATCSAPTGALEELPSAIGFTLPRAAQGEALRPGPRFSSLLEFSTWSPSVPFRIEVEVFPELEFLGGDCEAPHCPSCEAAVHEWTAEMGDWLAAKSSFRHRCSFCLQESSPEEWNWRQQAAIGTHGVSVWHVHWQEAAPSRELLAALGEKSGASWDYFFYQF